MVDDSNSTCANCGKPLKQGASFCTNCGTAVAATGEATVPPTGAATPPPVPPTATPPAPPAAGMEAPMAPPMVPSKKSKAPLIIGIIGGLLIAGGIVVLVLWLAVWRGGGGEAGSSNPVALAQKYMNAMEKGDIDAYMSCFEPGYFTTADNPILEDMGLTEDDIKEFLEMSMGMMDVSFSGVQLELESEQGDEATVVTTAGTAKVAVMSFENEIDLADDPIEFTMFKKGGTWYLEDDPMGTIMGSQFDFDELEDMDMDMEDMDMDMEDMDMDTEDMDLNDLQDLEDLDIEELLPGDLTLEDLENMSEEELQQLLEDLEQMLQEQVDQQVSTNV